MTSQWDNCSQPPFPPFLPFSDCKISPTPLLATSLLAARDAVVYELSPGALPVNLSSPPILMFMRYFGPLDVQQ